MAIYHYQMKTVKRSQGRSATAAAAYRSGERILDERTGLEHDYSKRTGVMLAEVILPDGGTVEREVLWNAAEIAEKRCNSVVAREFVVALPHELSRDQQQDLVIEYAKGLSSRTGWAIDVAVHAPGKEGDLRNVHAHLLCSTRSVQREASNLIVMGPKTQEWDNRSSGSELLRSERSEWEHCVNRSLERAHCVERVDCRSHAEKGSELLPQIHLGPTVMGMERKGIETERGDEHRRIAAHNAKVVELSKVREEKEQEQAFQVDLESMKTMPLAELEGVRARYEPKSVPALADEQELVKPEKERLDSHKREQRRLEAALERVHDGQRDNGFAETRFREAHPWQARLHDLGVSPHGTLFDIQEQGKALHGEKVEIEAAMMVSRVANLQSMQRIERLRGQVYSQAMQEYNKQSARYREVEAIYQPQKQAHERELKELARQERMTDLQRWRQMGVKELETEAKACSRHEVRMVALEYPEVKAAYAPLREVHYSSPEYEGFLKKEFGQYHERWEKELSEAKRDAEWSLKQAEKREAEWARSHPWKTLVYEVGLPNGEIAGIIRAREKAEQELKAAEKTLGVFRCERLKAEEKLEAAIEKVMPEAEKEASYRRERYEAIQLVLKPKQELERQQREQERQRERELRRGRGRGMER
jgi:hypothetical protein